MHAAVFHHTTLRAAAASRAAAIEVRPAPLAANKEFGKQLEDGDADAHFERNGLRGLRLKQEAVPVGEFRLCTPKPHAGTATALCAERRQRIQSSGTSASSDEGGDTLEDFTAPLKATKSESERAGGFLLRDDVQEMFTRESAVHGLRLNGEAERANSDDSSLGSDEELADFLEEEDEEILPNDEEVVPDADAAAVAEQYNLGTALEEEWEALKTLRLVFNRANIAEEQQTGFLKQLRREVFTAPDAYIVREGTMGDKFYIVTEGDVVITRNVERRPPRHKSSKADVKGQFEEILTHLYPGHFFGERSLLRETPRNANVKVSGTCSRVVVMSMSKDRFTPFIENDPNFKRMIGELALEQEERRRKRSQRNTANGNNALERDLAAQSAELKVAHVWNRRQTQTGQFVLNDWMTRTKIGKGSFGTVYLVQSITDSTKVAAMKKISRKAMRKASLGLGSDAEVLQEVAVMKMLTHKHVVNLFEVIDDTANDEILIVQEYMEYGPVMTEKEYNQPLELLVARKYLREMLLGLEYLHYQGVVHRDVKPSNLLVGADGVCRLADFGAAALTDDSELGWVKDIKGTPAFQPPECFAEKTGEQGYAGFAHDIWSLGATLHTMVVGVPPFMAANELELVQMLKTQDFRLSKNVALDPHLQNLLQRMLTKDPEQRATLEECVDHDWVTQEGSDPLPSFKYSKLNLKGALEELTQRMGSPARSRNSPIHGDATRASTSSMERGNRGSLPPRVPGETSPRDALSPSTGRGSPPMRSNRCRSHTVSGHASNLRAGAALHTSKSPDVRSMNRPTGAISAANVDGFGSVVGLGVSSPGTSPLSPVDGMTEFHLEEDEEEVRDMPRGVPMVGVQHSSPVGSFSARHEGRESPILGEAPGPRGSKGGVPPRLASLRGHHNSSSSPRMLESPRNKQSIGASISASNSVRRLDLGSDASPGEGVTRSEQATPRGMDDNIVGRTRPRPQRAGHSRAVSVGRAGFSRPTTVGGQRGVLGGGAAASGAGAVSYEADIVIPRGRAASTASRPTAKRASKRVASVQSAEGEAAAAAAKRHLRKLRQRQLSLIQGHEGVDSSVAEALLDQKRFAFHAARAEMIVEDIQLLGDDEEEDGRYQSNMQAPDDMGSPAPFRHQRSDGHVSGARRPVKSSSTFASTMDASQLATHLAAAQALMQKEHSGDGSFGPKPSSSTPQHNLTSGYGGSIGGRSPPAARGRAQSGSVTPGGGIPRSGGNRGRTTSEAEHGTSVPASKDRSLTGTSSGAGAGHNRRRSDASVYSNVDVLEEGEVGPSRGLREVLEAGGAGADFATIDSGTPKADSAPRDEDDFVDDITTIPKTPGKTGRGRLNSSTSERARDRRSSNVTTTEPQAVTDTNMDDMLGVGVGPSSPYRGGVPVSVMSDEGKAARMSSNISESASAHYGGGGGGGSKGFRHVGSMQSMGTTPGLGQGTVAAGGSLTKQGTWANMRSQHSPNSGEDSVGQLPTQRPRLASQYSETTRTSTSLSQALPVHNISDLGVKSPAAGVQPLHGRGMATPQSSVQGHAILGASGFFSPASTGGHGTPASSGGDSGHNSQRSTMSRHESERRQKSLQRYNDFVMVNVKVDASSATGASQKRVIFRARDNGGFSLAGAARTKPDMFAGVSDEALVTGDDSEVESVSSDMDAKGGIPAGSPKPTPLTVGSSHSSLASGGKTGSFKLTTAASFAGAAAHSALSEGSSSDSDSEDSDDDYAGITELDDSEITDALDELADGKQQAPGADEDEELQLFTPEEEAGWAGKRFHLRAEPPRQFQAPNWAHMNAKALASDTSSVRMLSRRNQEKGRLARQSRSSEELEMSGEAPASPGVSTKLRLTSSSAEEPEEVNFEPVQLDDAGNPAVTLCSSMPLSAAAAEEGGVDVPSEHIVFSPAGRNVDMGVLFGVAMLKGQRVTMEDRYIAVPDIKALPLTSARSAPEGANHGFYAVCDGHNGDTTAEMVAQLLAGSIASQSSLASDPVRALSDAFLATDSSVLDQQEESGQYSGSTAVSVLVRKSAGTQRPMLYCANVGDSRAVMCRAGQVVPLSDDHTCQREDEKMRLLDAGAYVTKGRLMGVLAVSRAFGDAEHKNIKEVCWGQSFTGETLLAEPEVYKEPVSPQDEFIVLACDGVYDVMTSQQVVSYVRRRLLQHGDVQMAAQELVAKAVHLASVDNCTAMVIALNQSQKES